MAWPFWIILAVVTVCAWAFVARRIFHNPWGDVEGGLLWVFGLLYVRAVHRLAVHGEENVPHAKTPGPLIIIANHTAGIDPLLIQSACPFPVRWMMAIDMRLPALEWFWKWIGIIDVDREGGASVTAVRDSMRHLRGHGVLGIFPEGQLERPARHLLPFQPGVGTLVQKTGALVLPVIIDGTPQVDPAWASLWRRSRSSIRFMPMIDYRGTSLTGEQIAQDLRDRFLAWTGWPAAEGSPPSARATNGQQVQAG
ncbi:MAG: 1-acyl-sn-glycerol-3-phosphate acyltransferase [Phycisphaeraceae bacterium]|nr:1-acyl-sn-glycerol-3-phosphate acyltransferase [Phycisphaeraceae bacterium]MCW5753831.1 1-acyl-sn-glycerol-3-phosphate acyltransferase [Phycisphaeraceae bacterium]